MTRTMAPIARAAAPPRRRSSRAATAGPIDPLTRSGRENRPGPAQQASTEATWTRHNVPAMESPHSGHDADRSTQGQPHAGKAYLANDASALSRDLLGGEAEIAARQRVFDEVLAAVELVLVADGAAFWREEADHSLILTASRFVSEDVLEALDRHAVMPLQSIMQRWPETPLVAVPLNDQTNPITEEIRTVTE